MKQITMNDIAEKAGVSKATVSMVINKDRRISEKTRRKILRIVKNFNYYPNELARKLSRGKTEQIGFLTPHFATPFVESILDAFEKRVLSEQKYINGIQPFATWNSTTLMENKLYQMLHGHTVDAVVILTQKPSEGIAREFHQRNIPLILVENKLPLTCSVQVDNVKGGYEATRHLIQLGRKEIGLITAEYEPIRGESFNFAVRDRFFGYRNSLKTHGIPFDLERITTVRDYDFNEGRLAVDKLLETRRRLDGIFCAVGDMVAMGAIKRLKELGKQVPKEVAVVGYDDIFSAQWFCPSLTTIKQPFATIANTAFDLAVGAISGKFKKEKHIVLKPEIVVRESA